MKTLILLHGTSRKRAENILKEGFADTEKMVKEMREGWGSVGEQGLTFFMRYYSIKNENERRDLEIGALHHAIRVADMDNDKPAVLLVNARVPKIVTDDDASWFRTKLKAFAEKKYAEGDKRYFRTYSMQSSSVSSIVASVATENLSMGEILRSFGVDAITDGDNVVVLVNPGKSIACMEVLEPNDLCAWKFFTGSDYRKEFSMSEEKLEECKNMHPTGRL